MTQRMPRLHVRVRGSFKVEALSMSVVLLHCLKSLLVGGVSLIGVGQSKPDVLVLHNPMGLLLEQSRSLPLRWYPEFDTRHPRIGGAIGVLEHPIAESSAPSQLKKEFPHWTTSHLRLFLFR